MTSFALIALSTKTEFTAEFVNTYNMELWFSRIIYYSEINQYGYLVHEVTTFIEMMARCEEKWITNWLESDDFSVFKFLRFLSLISRSVVLVTLAFVSPRIYCIGIILDNNVRSVKKSTSDS